MNPAKLLTTIQKPKVIVALVLISAATGAVAASVTITQEDPNKLEAAQGTMNDSTDLTVVGVSMDYTGLYATGVNVTVNNTASSDHTGNVSVAIYNETNGNIVASTEKNNVVLSTTTNSTISLDFTNEHRVDTFDRVDINVEEL